ncbi:MAG: 2'-5' RNA ligase family protein [Candidatus Woesearchaeota archaeon]
MSHYLVELRIFGKAKHEMKRLIWEVDRRFHLRRAKRFRSVPHVSLAGPFYTTQEKRLVNDFKKVCEKQEIMDYVINGFGTFEDSRVVYIDIRPDDAFDKFRWELSKKIRDYCSLRPYDLERKFHYHSTIAMKLRSSKFKQVKQYINKKPKLEYNHRVMRVTLIKNQRILYEYDFFLKRLLNRREAKSRALLEKTYNSMEQTDSNMKSPEISTTEEIDTANIKESFLDKINIFKKRKIFFISDSHFDHKNIIKYCNRPFKTTKEMNNFMLKKWNDTVRKNDIVFFIGDMTFGKGSRPADYWLEKLNGNIYFIRGFSITEEGKRNQHDRISRKKNVFDSLILKHDDRKFFLVHDPEQVPKEWKEWAICGHHHNNLPNDYPLVNKKTKKINVSVEQIENKPISIEKILELIK